MREGYLVDLQLCPYGEAYSFQKEIHRLRAAGQLPDTLILVEHRPVYTVGRAGGFEHVRVSREYLQSRGVEIHEIDRGGSITYHGPGQLVGYPIMDLELLGRDLHRYLRQVEEVIIRAAMAFGIEACRFPPHTGVWVQKKKIAAIGVGCRSWVTFHGFAFNVSTDLEYFSLIDPCGMKEYGVTSLSSLQGESVSMDEAKAVIVESFADVFDLSLEKVKAGEITALQKECKH